MKKIINNKINKKISTQHQARSSAGFAILFAVTLTSIILAIALGVADVALQEVKFGTSAKSTNDAFFAADTGIECALLNDKFDGSSFIENGSSGVVNCLGSNIALSGSYESGWSFILTNLSSSTQGCAKISVSKVDSAEVTTTTIVSKGYNIGDSSCNSTNKDRIEREIKTTYQTGSSSLAFPDFVWVDDSLPAGVSIGGNGGDNWTWVSSNPTPKSGSLANKSNLTSGLHEHFFAYYPTDQSNPDPAAMMSVNPGDTMVAFIYLNRSSMPSTVMIQWRVGLGGEDWDYRAYWGANNVDGGIAVNGTSPRYHVGPVPDPGSNPDGNWIRLTVPASQVGLEGKTVTGLSLTLYDGQATWDKIGKNP